MNRLWRHHLIWVLFLYIASFSSAFSVNHSSVTLETVPFSALPAWDASRAADGITALKIACLKPRPSLSAFGKAIPLTAWKAMCHALAQTPNHEAKTFIEAYFQPYRIKDQGNTHGLLTGYYTPSLQGSLQRSERYRVPIYGIPREAPLRTAFTRQQINEGALQGKAQEILWVDDAIDAFFLHIQGSGYVTLPNGRMMKLVFAGKNDYPYFAIGRYFIERGMATPEEMSMQWLKHWLRTHPDQANSIMQRNQSYIFFSLEKKPSAIRGADGTALTAMHSIAIDPAYLSYGLPLYLHAPFPNGEEWAGITVAQDTGTAIKGAHIYRS
jgi:membrane-bound lytic murein transglycosylase A